MIETIRRHPMRSGIIALFLLFLLLSTFAIVPETRQGIVVRFGKPVRIVNRYQPGAPFGSSGAGLAWRIPFAENIEWIDKPGSACLARVAGEGTCRRLSRLHPRV